MLVKGVEGDQDTSARLHNENNVTLKDPPSNGVELNEGTTEHGSYRLSRPLYIYPAQSVLAEKPQVAAFSSLYVTNAMA